LPVNTAAYPCTNDSPYIHADANEPVLVLGKSLVKARHAFLNVDGRFDGGKCRAELSQHGIACAVDQRASGAFNGWLAYFGPRRPKGFEGEVFRVLYQAHEAGEIGIQNCGKSPLRSRHGRYSRKRSSSRPAVKGGRLGRPPPRQIRSGQM